MNVYMYDCSFTAYQLPQPEECFLECSAVQMSATHVRVSTSAPHQHSAIPDGNTYIQT